MELEITPEPSAAEREAIKAALVALLADETAMPVSAWWRAGVAEATDDDEPEPA